MKRLWEYGGMLLAVVAAGCSDSKNEPNMEPVTPVEPEKPVEIVMPDIDGKTYNADDNFILEQWYMGSGGAASTPVSFDKGQHAVITLENKDNAIIRFYADDYDLADLGIDDISGKIARPSLWGIGDDISIPLEIKAATVDNSGYYVAEGSVSINNVKLHLYDVKITDNEFYGRISFGMNPHFEDYHLTLGLFKEYDQPYTWIDPEYNMESGYNCYQIVKGFDSKAYPDDIRPLLSPIDFIQVILNTPFLITAEYGIADDTKTHISATELFGNRLKNLWFPFSVGYCSISPSFNYYPTSTFSCSELTENSMLICFDPYKMVKANATEDSKRLYAAIFNALTPFNTQGIPINYHIERDEKSNRSGLVLTFSDNNMSERFTKNLLSTLLSDEGNRTRLIEQLKQNESLSPHMDIIASMIENYRELISGTTEATVGFHYTIVW